MRNLHCFYHCKMVVTRSLTLAWITQNCTNTKHISMAICPPTDYLCNDKITCIDRQWLCDGGADCPNGDDESMPNCQNKTCRDDQFQCNDMTCIPGHLMCSGAAECPDGSDEVNCSKFKSFEYAQIIWLYKVCDKLPEKNRWKKNRTFSHETW